MQCPQCEYIHPWYDSKNEVYDYKTEFGGFFTAPDMLRQSTDHESIAMLLGCPKCKLTFID
jgi:hypothetical protein